MLLLILALYLFPIIFFVSIILMIMSFFTIASLPLFMFSFFIAIIFTLFLCGKTRLYWYCPLLFTMLALSFTEMLSWNNLVFAGCSGLVPALLGILIGKWLRWLKVN